MKKRCDHCGRYMYTRFHGACLQCLRSMKLLPPALRGLYEMQSGFVGKTAHSVRGLLNAAHTLILDGDTYCVKWDPIHILRKNLETSADRDYLTPEMVAEIQQIIEEVEHGQA